MEIKADVVKKLRDKTGAGMMDCKGALQESKGDFERALEILRIKGIAKASKRTERTAKEGLIYAYIHPGSRIGVMVEVNCETDFVARTKDFGELTKDLAMHVAAANPKYLKPEDVPADVISGEKKIYEEQARESGKPEKAFEKIVEGRVRKFYEENCLLNQRFIRDEDKTVADIVKDAIAKIGENITVKRFARFQLGEGTE